MTISREDRERQLLHLYLQLPGEFDAEYRRVVGLREDVPVPVLKMPNELIWQILEREFPVAVKPGQWLSGVDRQVTGPPLS